MDAWPDDMDVAEGAARIEAATIFQISRLAHSWAGLRTFAPDKTPVVGRDPMVPGFVWFVGQGGYGIQTAPAMSRIIASLIAHDQLPTDVADFGVDKASLSVARFRARA
jgi:D-arginine dehydrogenase